MSNIFLDCGSGHGEGLIECIKKYNINNSWKIFSFEANPYTFNYFNSLIFIHPILKKMDIKAYNLGVWIRDEKKEMNLEGANLENYNFYKDFLDELKKDFKSGKTTRYINLNVPDWGGSSFLDKDMFDKTNKLQEKMCEFKETAIVDCIDFSKWINNNFSNENNLFLKMDIEGAEYQVLEKLIEDKTIHLFKSINVEFHDWILKDKIYYDKTEKLKEFFKKNNIKLEIWR